MAKFRRPIELIDAMQFTGEVDPVIAWAQSLGKGPTEYPMSPYAGHLLSIKTPSGIALASPGDWIIRDAQGAFHPCPPGYFAAAFEPVSPAPTGADTERGRDDG